MEVGTIFPLIKWIPSMIICATPTFLSMILSLAAFEGSEWFLVSSCCSGQQLENYWWWIDWSHLISPKGKQYIEQWHWTVEWEDLTLNCIKQKAQERLCPGLTHGIPEGQEVDAQGIGTGKQKEVPAKSSIHTMLGCGNTNIPLNRETKKRKGGLNMWKNHQGKHSDSLLTKS